MKLDFGTHITWREIGIRIALNKWYSNNFFIEFNAWKWFATLSFELKAEEDIDEI